MKELRLIVLENIKELGEKVSYHLRKENPYEYSANTLITVKPSRFSNGEGKVQLDRSVRDKDVFILSDVGNYGLTYLSRGKEKEMGPDEHFQDIKRVISAASGHANKISVIMPLLYQSRQHKRKSRESLDCAIALQDLEKLGVEDIITFDAHDPSVSNAIPLLPFENFYPTHMILEQLLERERESIHDLLVVSPDMGASERARYYAEMLHCDIGVFYKRRDLSQVVDGRNLIVEHMYMGPDVRGKNVLVTDDMIASGESILEVATELKKRGAQFIYLIATFALFTKGIDKFLEAYKEGQFDKLYSTNLSYVPEEIKQLSWYVDVDCSEYLASIIRTLNKQESIEPLLNGKEKILRKMKELQS